MSQRRQLMSLIQILRYSQTPSFSDLGYVMLKHQSSFVFQYGFIFIFFNPARSRGSLDAQVYAEPDLHRI